MQDLVVRRPRYVTNWVASGLRSPTVYWAFVAALARQVGPAVYSWTRSQVLETIGQLGNRQLSDLVDQFSSSQTSVGLKRVRPVDWGTQDSLETRHSVVRASKSGTGMAMPGFYGKKFRLKKRKRPSKIRFAGYESSFETGTQVIDSGFGAVYVGHGVAYHVMHVAFWGAILRRLFQKAGHDIASWTAKVQDGLDSTLTLDGTAINIFYRRTGNAAVQAVTINAATMTNATYEFLAQQIHIQFQSIYADNRDMQLTEIVMENFEWLTAPTVRQYPPLARVNLREGYMELGFSSSIAIQNRTPSGVGVETDDQVDVVDNNPIHGKVYEGYGNGFKYGFADSPASEMLAHVTNGLVTVDFASTDSNMQNVYRRPPSNRNAFIGCKRVGNTRLQPGQIRKGYITYKKRMHISHWVKVFTGAFELVALPHYFPLGKIQLYGFDKMCRTTADRPVALGIEINQRYTGLYYNAKTETMATHYVNTVAPITI